MGWLERLAFVQSWAPTAFYTGSLSILMFGCYNPIIGKSMTSCSQLSGMPNHVFVILFNAGPKIMKLNYGLQLIGMMRPQVVPLERSQNSFKDMTSRYLILIFSLHGKHHIKVPSGKADVDSPVAMTAANLKTTPSTPHHHSIFDDTNMTYFILCFILCLL